MRFERVRSGLKVVVSVFVMESCMVVLDVRLQPKAWSPYMSNVEPHMHLVSEFMIGSLSLRCRRSVNCALAMRFDGSLLGRLWRAKLVKGLRRLGRNLRMHGSMFGVSLIIASDVRAR